MNWFLARWLSRSSASSRRSSARRTSSRFRPQIEALEARQLMAVQVMLEQAGFAPLLITDNGPGDNDAAIGALTFVGAYGTFGQAIVVMVSKPTLGTPTSAQTEVHAFFMTMTGGTVQITAGDTDFAVPALGSNPLTLTSQVGGGFSGGTPTVSLQSFADPSNAPFGTAAAAGLHGPFTGAAFSDEKSANFNRGVGPYSVTQKATLTIGSAGLGSWDHVVLVTGNQMPTPAALGDFVFEDLNADGIQDGGEPGIANVQVKLLQGGVVVGTTTTDTNGLYRFSNLTPGDYQVMFVAPVDYVFSDPNQGGNDALDSDADLVNGMTGMVSLVSGETDLTVDAGMFRAIPQNTAQLGDFVFEDLDADGIQDAGEQGIANVQVRLFTSGNVLVGTTTTDANGFYRFTGLAAGSYYLIFTTPAGYVISPRDRGGNDALDSDIDPATGRTTNITLADGAVDLRWDAGLYRGSSLSGFVYVDRDNDGVFDGGETPIAGVKITLTGVDDMGNAVMRMATTDVNGAYRFTDLRAGTYQVNETQPVNYLDGKDAVGSVGGALANDQVSAINLRPNVAAVNYNFGEVVPSGLSGCVYHDRGKDGTRQPGDTGIPGVRVILTGIDDQGRAVTLTQITDAAGCYSFVNLRSGSYRVRTSRPRPYLRGATNPGTTGGTPSVGVLSNIPLPMGINSLNNDFGLILPARISKAFLLGSRRR